MDLLGPYGETAKVKVNITLRYSAQLILHQTSRTAMESCLQDVKSWMILNKLKMNDSKTECILIGSYQQLAKINLTSILVGEHRITVLVLMIFEI